MYTYELTELIIFLFNCLISSFRSTMVLPKISYSCSICSLIFHWRKCCEAQLRHYVLIMIPPGELILYHKTIIYQRSLNLLTSFIHLNNFGVIFFGHVSMYFSFSTPERPCSGKNCFFSMVFRSRINANYLQIRIRGKILGGIIFFSCPIRSNVV